MRIYEPNSEYGCKVHPPAPEVSIVGGREFGWRHETNGIKSFGEDFVWKSLKSSDKLLKALFNAVRNDADDAWSKISVKIHGSYLGTSFCRQESSIETGVDKSCGCKHIIYEARALLLDCYVSANKVVQATSLNE